MRRATVPDQPRQHPRIVQCLAARHDDTRSGHQGQVQLETGDIEGHRGYGQKTIPRCRPQLLLHAMQEIAKIAMRNLHALRPSRRSGGIEDIGNAFRCAQVRLKPVLAGQRISTLGLQQSVAASETCMHMLFSNQHRWRSIIQHQRDAFLRAVQFNWQVGGARTHDRQKHN